MKIKRLDILGFKSFIDKVSLDFQQGITGVVGPNGCGKSNIVDAIRWVMGEQNARHLRGRSMEDIIFGGSESRKPHGMAQVSIVFDNSAKVCPPAYQDYAEIMVTRRLYRSGESEYLINKTVCRLLDITELFMDTGVGARAYSIIEQGKVGMLVSAKPEERRALIEEAAGVTKFKSRKKTALRKMDATGQNLVRLGDIIAEVRRQLGSLKRQAQRAEQFREYRGESKRIELCLTGNRFQELYREIELLATQEKEQSTILARLDARLEEGDLQLEEKHLRVAEVENELSRAQEQVFHLASEIQRVESELLMAGRQREQLSNQDQQLQAELTQSAERLAALRAEHEQLQQEEDSFAGRLETVQQAVEIQEEELRQALSQEQQLHTQLESSRRELLELLAEAGRLANRRDEIERRLTAEADRKEQAQADSIRVREQQQQLVEQQQQLDRQIRQVDDGRRRLAEQVQQLQQRRQEKARLCDAREVALTSVRQQLEKSRSRQESLQELERNFAGYAEGVRALLAEKTSWQQIAADLFTVAPEYELVVEMALGQRLQAVPVADVAQADAALQLLSARQQRATLLLPPVAPPVVAFSAGTALATLVKALPGHQQQVDLLLAGVYLVDSVVDFSSASLPPGILLVDHEGRSLSWQGELTGGATVVDSSGLLRKRRQLEELTAEIAQLDDRFVAGQRELGRSREELQQLDEELSAAADEGHRLELQALELAKDRQGLQTEAARVAERLELIVFNLEQVVEVRAALQQEKNALSAGSRQSDEQQQLLEQRSAGVQEQLTELRQRLDGTREELTERRVALAALQQQQRALSETLVRLAKQQRELEQRSTQLQQRQQAGRAEQQTLLQSDERLRVELDLLLDRREQQQHAGQAVR
ncbi:MAG: chromosome segregation protein SMC, partial [Deltaproteobacteria bacterium]|nr:chromosome segregation protein SMC [Deltaproteobacteria bacterium]